MKKDDLELFFVKFNKTKGVLPLKQVVIKEALQYLETSYKYDFVSV